MKRLLLGPIEFITRHNLDQTISTELSPAPLYQYKTVTNKKESLGNSLYELFLRGGRKGLEPAT